MRRFARSSASLAAGVLASLGTPAAAAGEAPPADAHATPSTDIVVTATIPRDRQSFLSGVSVVQGEQLAQMRRPTLGDTLDRIPGVSATSFGPNASRPVLRGLQGERVRILTDGIGAFDVSNTSADHAVVVNPLLAERIEVLRGPATLQFGSSAIGGVVNVIDRRFPRVVPDEAVHADVIATYGTAAEERSFGGAVDVPIGRRFVINANGSYAKTADLRIGDTVLSRRARATALANAGTETDEQIAEGISLTDNAALRGRLPNSDARTWTAGVGAAFIDDRGTIGVAYSRYASLYGIPLRYATGPDQEQEGPRLDVAQDRLDLRAEINADGAWLKALRLRAGHASYRHFELEDGAIGTAFYTNGLEGRFEAVQATRGPWTGASGIQYFSRDFNVVGDEAFLPRNSTRQFGLFTHQQLDFGALEIEGGARYEHKALSSNPGADEPQFFRGERRFDTVSASIGASYGLAQGVRAGVNLSRAVRSPSAEELFANGPHAGTQAFEVGNPDFRSEKSWGLEGTLRARGVGFSVEASIFHNWFDDFIYEDVTDAIEDGLPVYQFRQARARSYGFEVQGSATLAAIGSTRIVADGLIDYVRATIVNVGPAPRIPPLRALGGLALNTPAFDVRGEVEWTDGQHRISAFETPTDGFTLVNAEVNWRPFGAERPLAIALSAQNIFDVDARRHASFLKDFAPRAGRDLRITARLGI